MEVKQCNTCKTSQPLEHFRIRTRKDKSVYFFPKCKECERVYARKYRNDNIEQATESNKIWRENNADYGKEYRSKNKEKIKEYNAKYEQNNKDKIKEHKKEYRAKPEVIARKKEYNKRTDEKKKEETKQKRIKILIKASQQTEKECSQCKVIKPLNTDNFKLKKTKIIENIERKYWNSECIECERKRDREYNKNNKDKIRIKSSKRWKETKALCNSDEKYREEFKEIRRQANKQQRQKPKNKIRNSVSRLIKFGLNGESKNGSVWEYLNYTLEELKYHLESLFEPWMSWNNYGAYRAAEWDENDSTTWVWQLDHIIPHSEFCYVSMECEGFKKCWALDNLRPLSAKQNVLDGVHRIRHK